MSHVAGWSGTRAATGATAAGMTLALVAACGGHPADEPLEAPATVESPSPVPAAQPAAPAPEHHQLTFEWDGLEREYRLDVPADRDPDEEVPLVVVLHGGGGSAASIRAQARPQVFAQEFGAIVAYPQAERGAWGVNPDRDLDDVGFITALVGLLVAEWGVAPGEVYAAGYSMGAEMSYRLAVKAPEVFAAIAPIAGNIVFPPDSLDPASPVSVVGVVGLADRAVAETGSLDLWRELLDCQQSEPVVDAGAEHVTRIDATCADGSEVVEYRLEGVPHTWPNEQAHGFATNEAIWDVFSAHAGR
jgi:polyhydroxybutyrate depolymerase